MNCRLLVSVAALCVLVAATLPVTQAWWCTGHMLTATIAQRRFTDTTWSKVKPLIEYLASSFPKSPEYVSSACWADDLKAYHQYAQASKHFINLPYIRSPLYTGVPKNANDSDVVSSLENMAGFLISAQEDTAPTDLQARALRFVIHFTGDSHQPLHATTLYNQARFPNGDEGGNKYLIKGANVSELHAFFDSGAGQWQSDPPRPLAPNSTQYLNEWADLITQNYPYSSFPLSQVTDIAPADWAGDSLVKAIAYAYTTPYNDYLADDFVSKARSVCQAQVALGGYRLAAILNHIFDPSTRQGKTLPFISKLPKRRVE